MKENNTYLDSRKNETKKKLFNEEYEKFVKLRQVLGNGMVIYCILQRESRVLVKLPRLLQIYFFA